MNAWIQGISSVPWLCVFYGFLSGRRATQVTGVLRESWAPVHRIIRLSGWVFRDAEEEKRNQFLAGRCGRIGENGRRKKHHCFGGGKQ